MDETDFEGLKVLLAGLPAREADTAQRCWEPFYWGDGDDSPLGGIMYAAWGYQTTMNWSTPEPAPDGRPKKTPHEVEKELLAIAASARDLSAKIGKASPECLAWIEGAALTVAPLLPSGWNDQQRLVEHSDLNAWFQIRRGTFSADGSIEEVEPWWGQDGMRPFELEALAQVLEEVSKGAAAQKQAPNGPRAGVTGRNRPVEFLLHSIGKMVSFRKRPMSHIIPIGRVVHEWVTGQVAGNEWGQRPFERVKPMIKNIVWDEPNEVRTSTHNPWMPPGYAMWRIQAMKQYFVDMELGK